MPAHRTRDTNRSLEVITDAPVPPSLTIVSPTPRSFSFPNSATENPYLPPSSCSPFEPAMFPTKLLTPSPRPMLRTLSPVSPASTSTASSTSYFPASPSTGHKRRKSSCSDIPERRPKKGDEDYVKRPENAFILFRRKCCEERQTAQDEATNASTDGTAPRKQRQADLSKTISQQWRALSSAEKAKWEALAKEKKKEHEELYPNYVYRPQRNKERERAKKAGKSEDEQEGHIQFLMPWPAPAPTSTSTRHGRSASAPTPPPGFATIQLPTVYMPSCPASPSLMPMINRRLPHPNYQREDVASQFDYIPQGQSSLLPPPGTFSQPSVFDAPPRPTPWPQEDCECPPIRRRATPTLQHLTIPQENPALLPSNSIVSPASSAASSSSPSSPNQGPFTPVNPLVSGAGIYSMPPQGFKEPQIAGIPEESAKFGGVDLSSVDFPSYEYSEWDTGAFWPNDMSLNDAFDFTDIPPLTLETGYPEVDGLPESPVDYHSSTLDFAESPVEHHTTVPAYFGSQHREAYQHPQHGPFDNLFGGFPEMMTEQCF